MNVAVAHPKSGVMRGGPMGLNPGGRALGLTKTWIIFGGKCFSLPEIYRISVEIRVIVDAEKNTWRVHGIVHTV